MIPDGKRTSHQTLSSSLALRSPLRKRNRPPSPPPSCEEIAHYPIFNPQDPRHNPAASSSWLRSSCYQSEASKSQTSIRWMQDLPRRSLRKARSGLLALRSGMQRRPLPDNLGHTGDIPNIWSSTDSTGDSSDQFPSSVSDASTEDDGEFGVDLYRAVRNHSSSMNVNMESGCHDGSSTAALPCYPLSGGAKEGSSQTLKQETVANVSTNIMADEDTLESATSSTSCQKHVVESQLGGHAIDESSAQIQPSSRVLSDSSSISFLELSPKEVVVGASQKSAVDSQPTANCAEETCSQLQDQSPGPLHSEHDERSVAESAVNSLRSGVGVSDGPSRGHETDPEREGSDAGLQTHALSRSPSNSPSISPRQSSAPQITGVQLVMEPLQLFPRRDFSGQTLCCSDVAEDHSSPETTTGDFVNFVAREDAGGEPEPPQNSPLSADERLVSHMDVPIIESSYLREEVLEETTASGLLPILSDADFADSHGSSDSIMIPREHSPCHTDGAATELTLESNSAWSPIENELPISSLSFRDEFFFVDGKSSDIRPDRGDNPTKAAQRIARDGSIYNGPGLDRNLSIRTQDIPEIIGPGRTFYRMHASRPGNLFRLDRDGSDSTDDCVVTYPMWERRQCS